eukprot:3037278-Ditylum_brightwellii.AAC.1
MSTFVPGGANGVALYLNMPWGYSYANNLGLMWHVLCRFTVIIAWGSNLPHRCIGKCGCVDARPAMKWCLNTWMAFSAAFLQWIWGGTS